MNNNYSRRDFIKVLTVGAAALALPEFMLSQKKPAGYRANVGFQLYTVRHELEKDFEGTIRKVAAMGFLGVETYPLPANVTLEQAAKVFKENGLDVFSMHTELPIDAEREHILKMADAYDCRNVVYPGWPKGIDAHAPDLMDQVGTIFKTLDDTKRRVELYNGIDTSLRSKGLHFGLHNHWWEFEKFDGVVPFYYFLERLNKDMFFEIDTYWAKAGGQDPATAVHDFGKRAPFLHIKDGTARKDATMFAHVPVGSGSQNFTAIVKAGGTNTKWMVVEFDEYTGDIFDGLQTSYTYLIKNGLAKGKVG